MKKIIFTITTILLFSGYLPLACGNISIEKDKNKTNKNNLESMSENNQKKRVASDNATIQTTDKNRATRVIEDGTKINIHFGDVIIPGTLNNSKTAKALIEMLPYTVQVNRYSHDFCGVMKNPLPYSEENVHYGWLNGDIDFATDADYFTILFEDEENSERYGYQVNIGKIDCELSTIRNLKGSYNILIELAE